MPPFNAFAGEHYISVHNMFHRITVGHDGKGMWMVDATEYAATVDAFGLDACVSSVTEEVDLTLYSTSRSAFEAGLRQILLRT